MDLPLLNEEQVLSKIAEIRDPPSLPIALQRVLELIVTQVESPDELETFIRYDPGLTARIIRIANSAYYGSRGKLLDLTRSILLIGYDEVKSVCIFALTLEVFSGLKLIKAAEGERLWKHSFATARIAYEMALRRPWVAKEQAYLLGFLHDFGRIIVAAHFGEQYQAIRDLAKKRKVPLRCVEPQFNLEHTLIGSWISTRWAMPEVVRNTMEFHHEPEKSPSFKPEVKLIALANILANSVQFPGYLEDDFTRMYRDHLYISQEEWEEYQDRLKELWPEVDHFWSLLK
jgi:putative nucleotidyltransferase with HDIG domain